jgi:hypothetical protein
MDTRSINWQELARDLGSLDENGRERACGSRMAQKALELILGRDFFRQAVDYYITYQPGKELVRQVLWLVQPVSAMDRCYEIYKSDAPQDDRVAAIELLRVVADSRTIPWVGEFLDDHDPSIQHWGVGILDQMLWGGSAQEEQCLGLLEKARQHPSAYVRERAAFIDSFLKKRNSPSESR